MGMHFNFRVIFYHNWFNYLCTKNHWLNPYSLSRKLKYFLKWFSIFTYLPYIPSTFSLLKWTTLLLRYMTRCLLARVGKKNIHALIGFYGWFLIKRNISFFLPSFHDWCGSEQSMTWIETLHGVIITIHSIPLN